MEGGCQIPIAGYAHLSDQDEIVLTGLVASPDGKTIYKDRVVGQTPEELGVELANLLNEHGAQQLLAEVKKELEGE
jgi:hydroxymethylbilane synthase